MSIDERRRLRLLVAFALASAALGISHKALADRWDWRNNPDRFGGTMVTELTQLPTAGEASMTPWASPYDPRDAASEAVLGGVRDTGSLYEAAFPDLEQVLAEHPGDDLQLADGPLGDYVATSLTRCATAADLDRDGNGAVDEQEDMGDDEHYLLAHDEQEDVAQAAN